MSKDVIVFKRNETYAAFNRLDLEVAYGNDVSNTVAAVINKKVSVAAFRKLAAQQKVDFRVLYLMLTNYCNFDCKYCYEKELTPKIKNMSTKLARKSIRVMLYNLRSETSKPVYLYLYGGEPLLNLPALKAATLFFRKETLKLKRESYINVVTNGSLLTKEIAKFLKNNSVNVSISIDGSKAVNDSERIAKNGSSAYDNASSAIMVARSVGLPVDLSLTIGYHNIERIKEQVEFLSEVFKPGRIVLNSPIVKSEEDLKLARSAFSKLIKLRKYLWDNDNAEGTLPLFVKRFVQKERGWQHCPCHRHQLVVRCDGVVGPCLLLQNEGAYFKHTIDELAKTYSENSPFEEFTDRASVNIKECAKCPAIMICRGGCAANALKMNGSTHKQDPMLCSFANEILEEIIWSTYELRPSEKVA